MARDNDFFSRTIGQADGERDSTMVQPSGVDNCSELFQSEPFRKKMSRFLNIKEANKRGR